jgi:guanylate kinase
MARANDEMSHWAEYDYVVVNRDLDRTLAQIHGILSSERLKRRRLRGIADFVNKLRHESDQMDLQNNV